MWRSWLAHHVRDVGVVCSSQIIPTQRRGSEIPDLFFVIPPAGELQIYYYFFLVITRIDGFSPFVTVTEPISSGEIIVNSDLSTFLPST